MTASSLIVDYINVGLAAARPATPSLATGAFGLYYATDTGVLSVWTGSSWTTLSGSGTVTSIIASLGLTGGTITSTGTITAQTPEPQGRLSLVSATPVMTSDQTAKTTIYYVEKTGNSCPVYDGTTTRPLTFSNISLILDTSNHLLENLYDVYLWNSSGAATLGASPAWVNTATVTWTSASPGVCTWTGHSLYEGAPVIFTAGTSTPTGITAGTTYYVSKTGLTANAFSVSTTVANAAAGTNVNTSSTGVGTQTGTNHTTLRGTGAGTAELQLKNGIWTNKNAITLFNNSVSSGSIAANQATYLGTFYCTANGQTGMALKPAAAAGGTANILGLYNAYNRVRTIAMSRDATSTSWTYAVNTWRESNGNVANRITYVDGLAESFVRGDLRQSTSATASSAGAFSVNQDSTATNPGAGVQAGNASTAWHGGAAATVSFPPIIGVHFLCPMERALAGTQTMYGIDASSNQMNGFTVELEM